LLLLIGVPAFAVGGAIGVAPPRDKPVNSATGVTGGDSVGNQGGVVVEMRPAASPIIAGGDEETRRVRRVIATDGSGRVVAVAGVTGHGTVLLRVPRGAVVRVQIEGIAGSVITRDGSRVSVIGR